MLQYIQVKREQQKKHKMEDKDMIQTKLEMMNENQMRETEHI